MARVSKFNEDVLEMTRDLPDVLQGAPPEAILIGTSAWNKTFNAASKLFSSNEELKAAGVYLLAALQTVQKLRIETAAHNKEIGQPIIPAANVSENTTVRRQPSAFQQKQRAFTKHFNDKLLPRLEADVCNALCSKRQVKAFVSDTILFRVALKSAVFFWDVMYWHGKEGMLFLICVLCTLLSSLSQQRCIHNDSSMEAISKLEGHILNNKLVKVRA